MDNHEDLLTGLTSGQMNCKRGYVRELVPCHELINHFSSFFFFFFYNVTEEKLVLECAEEPRRKPVAGRSWNCRESNVHIQCTYKYQVHSKFRLIVHFEIRLSFYFCLFSFLLCNEEILRFTGTRSCSVAINVFQFPQNIIILGFRGR